MRRAWSCPTDKDLKDAPNAKVTADFTPRTARCPGRPWTSPSWARDRQGQEAGPDAADDASGTRPARAPARRHEGRPRRPVNGFLGGPPVDGSGIDTSGLDQDSPEDEFWGTPHGPHVVRRPALVARRRRGGQPRLGPPPFPPAPVPSTMTRVVPGGGPDVERRPPAPAPHPGPASPARRRADASSPRSPTAPHESGPATAPGKDPCRAVGLAGVLAGSACPSRRTVSRQTGSRRTVSRRTPPTGCRRRARRSGRRSSSRRGTGAPSCGSGTR
ncbi:hypothetical protein SCANM63S_00793 [Streptomyces canarius]